MKLRILSALLLFCGMMGYGQNLPSPYSNVVFPSQTFTATGQTGAAIQLNGLTVTSTVGSSFASGNITLTGSSLTTATFSLQGSADNGKTYFPIAVAAVSTPGSTLTNVTATAPGLYQVSLAGLTHVRFSTSGTFTATNVGLTLTASPNGLPTSLGGNGGGSGGAEFPSTNGTVCNTSTTASQQCTAEQISAPMVTASANVYTAKAFGDSMVVGAGAFSPTNGLVDVSYSWANLMSPTFGVYLQNYAVGGIPSVAINDEQVNVNTDPKTGSLFFMDSGFTNDTESYGNNANWLLIAQRAEQGMLFRNLIPDVNKNFLQSATLAGGFALDGVTYKAAQGVTSSTNGAHFTQLITLGPSGVLEGCYMVYNGGTGTFSLSVNGTPQTDPIGSSTTWIASGDGGQAIDTGGTTKFCAGFRLPGFSANSTVSVVVTQTASGTVDFQWLGSPPAAATTNPAVYIMDVPQLASSASNYTFTGLYQSIVTTIQGFAIADGQNMFTVPARLLLGANPGANFTNDGVHPNTTGYALIANSAVALGQANGNVTNVPIATGSRAQQLYVPVTNDITKGFTLGPGNNINALINSGWGDLQTFSYGKGTAMWSGEAVTNIFSGHIFGMTNNAGYAFCYTNPVNSNSYIYSPQSMNGCSIITTPGNARFAINSSAQWAESIAENRIDIGFYGQVNTWDNFVPLSTFGSAQSRAAGVNYSSSNFGAQAVRSSGSTNPCAAAYFHMSIPSSGDNALASFTLDTGTTPQCGSDGFDLDLSSAYILAIKLAANTTIGGVVPLLQLSGTTGSIGGSALTAGSCSTGTATVPGAVVGNPVAVGASDGTLPNPLVSLSGSVTAAGTVSVQVCAIAPVTPASKTYNVNAL